MSALQRLHEARVDDAWIDTLGHLNVRVYHELAFEASRALASAHGLSPGACRDLGAVLGFRDTFTRHYREQLAGARLAVMGGVLSVHAEGLRVYHELVNEERNERAAVFVHEVGISDRATRRPLPLPEMLARSASAERVAWPEHGRPRTLDLEAAVTHPTLDVARERGLAIRAERRVQANECDADGVFVASRYVDLFWGGEHIAGNLSGVPTFELPDGGKFGWASLESRGTLHELPRAGARIQCFGAEVGLAAKTSHRRHWVYDLDTGRIQCTHAIVNLAFDLERRRAAEIPPLVRATLEASYHPDLR